MKDVKQPDEVYAFSRDYKKLFEIVTLNEGLKIPCFVDYNYKISEETRTIRDVASVKCKNGCIDIGVRGTCYSDMDINKPEHFIKDCERMNLEFIMPKAYARHGIDFNNFRMQVAFKMDDVTKTLNRGVYDTGGYVSVGDKKTSYVNCQRAVVVDVEDLQEDMDELRSLVWTLLCCFEEKNPNYQCVFEEVEKNGGLARFNDEEKEEQEEN